MKIDINEHIKKNTVYKIFTGTTLPMIAAYATHQLLGFVDFIILGKYTNINCMGGLAIGITLWSSIYWLLGFFRIITIEYSSQSIKTGKEEVQVSVFLRHIIMAILVSIVVLLFKDVIWETYSKIQVLEKEILNKAEAYYNIVIWSTPLMTANYVISGWLLGRGRVKRISILQILSNASNILLDLLFINKFHMGIEGIALATLITEVMIFSASMIMALCDQGMILRHISKLNLWWPKDTYIKIRKHLDVMIRIICIVFIMNVIVVTGSMFGVHILVVNTIIFQVKNIMSSVFESVANSIVRFIGESKESKDIDFLRNTYQVSLECVMYLSIIMVIVYELGRMNIINYFGYIDRIRSTLRLYDGWIAMFPLLAGWGLSAYNLYNNVKKRKSIKKTYLLPLFLFLCSYSIAVPYLGNHGVWLAFIVFYVTRSVVLLGYEGYIET